MKKNIISVLITFLIISSFNVSLRANPVLNTTNNFHLVTFNNNIDYDTLTDINVTVKINSIRALKQIDNDSNADFFVKILINNLEFVSPVFYDNKYLYDLNFSVTNDVPDDVEIVEIKIILYDKDNTIDEICDISGDKNSTNNIYTAKLFYNIKTGHWNGSDYINDNSGYGRLNGCDDGSIYEDENDCEIWFNIYQNDYDSDDIPYWTEVNIYETDPMVNNQGEDPNGDGIPIEWDWKWGYEPFKYDNHSKLDSDNDGLNNLEEYLTSKWMSDPFRKDIFIELDQMDLKKNNNTIIMPNSTKDLLSNVYHRRNIVFHLDDGCMGGGEIIPYIPIKRHLDILKIYKKYFLNNNPDNYKRSIFRYAIVLDKSYCNAKAFVGEGSFINSDIRGINSFFITINTIEKVKNQTNYSLDFIYACYILHETGHTLGIDIFNPMGCDNIFTTKPWMLGYWLYCNYKSVMNYRYTIHILDYSDGIHGKRDYNDWGNIDFTWFEIPR